MSIKKSENAPLLNTEAGGKGNNNNAPNNKLRYESKLFNKAIASKQQKK